MSRISDFLTIGSPVVVAPATTPPTQAAGRHAPDSFWAEFQDQAQGLLSTILRAKAADGSVARLIGLTSLYRHEGVTTIASVLARSAAAQRRTLLIEANWMHPALADLCSVPAQPGLFQILSGDYQPAECIRELPSGVSVLTVGRPSNRRCLAIQSESFLPLIRDLTESFELLFIDLPAIRETPATFELCSILDGVALVVEAERVHWQAGQRELVRLRQSGAHLLGAVLNKRRDYVPDWLYRIL
jgi:Mrp family chromosome partitioning ATPase